MNIAAPMMQNAGHLNVAGAPEGLDAWLSAAFAETRDGPVIFIAREDSRMAAVIDALSFFAPDLPVFAFPAWDCLPYDRVSPHADIVAQRMETLFALSHRAEDAGPCIIVTTVNAAIQKVPPPDVIGQSGISAKTGETVNLEELKRFLAINGYIRSSTVIEHGDFAIRGDIVDIFPPASERPLRLDFFGDVLESVREFDPLTQRTTGKRDHIHLLPVSEVFLNQDAIDRFRRGYLTQFGADNRDDPLYRAISEGRKHQGMEHWLALFHEDLSTLFDFVPGAAITVDHLAEEAVAERRAMIEDYYHARAERPASAIAEQMDYKPLPPEGMYLTAQEFGRILDTCPVRRFTPYKLPKSEEGIDAGGKRARDFAPERNQSDINLFDALAEHLADLVHAHKRIVIAAYSTGSRERLQTVLADHGIRETALVDNWQEAERLPAATAALTVLRLEHGFETSQAALITEQDILGDRLVRKPQRSRRAADFIEEASALAPDDLVVHAEHGIGRFTGLRTIEVSGHAHDCVDLEYEGGDKLLVPVENIDVLSRYGTAESDVQLDKLGGHQWQARKAKLKKDLMAMADQLIRTAAERELRDAKRIETGDGFYQEFCARFPYQETEDQDRAIEEVLTDLASGRPMDRLICGDVGFGKTEVAIRAAFLTAMSGQQVALIVPTTLLARQHYDTFSARFAGLPVKIAQLSRLVTAKQAGEVKHQLATGELDIVIGTHALLQKSIEFRRLGLVIVDEEQHFGVKHKERLKDLRQSVHVLTLTATPIPRTLQLAMSGLRGLSLIATPPVDRLAVRTYVMPFDTLIIREALLREHYRGGQSFFVAPRISDLGFIEKFVRREIPEISYAVAHGRLPARELEDVMNAFYEGAYDVLICTSIIESGLDIPTANTMIIHRADMFGLSQLYQMRGRIGRSKVRGYAYFTIPAGRVLTANAQKRLDVLQTLDTLGAGFSLASHDLDIRGAGNLLGEEQSGHIREVGMELYQHMLEEAVAQAKTKEGRSLDTADDFSPQINLGSTVLIPDDYVEDLDVRMGLYRRIAHIDHRDQIDQLAAEMIDRFGPLPDEVTNLLQIIEIRELCRTAMVRKIDAGPKGAVINFHNNEFPNIEGLVEFLSNTERFAKLRPDHSLVLKDHWPQPVDRIRGAKQILEKLATLARVKS